MLGPRRRDLRQMSLGDLVLDARVLVDAEDIIGPRDSSQRRRAVVPKRIAEIGDDAVIQLPLLVLEKQIGPLAFVRRGEGEMCWSEETSLRKVSGAFDGHERKGVAATGASRQDQYHLL